ncbi:MAG: permease-like cell division protein FtsX [Microbacteriaceae bacterium]
MRLGLVFSEAASGLRRNITMVISVVLVTFISLTFVGAAILLQQQIGQMKGYWYDRAQVTISMCTATDSSGTCADAEATDEQKDLVEAQLTGDTLTPFIERYEFENHEQAYENFKKSFKGSPLVEFASPEFLPESFRVKLKDPRQAAVLIESLSGLSGVQGVKDERAYLDPILNMLNVASYAAIGLAALMLIAAALLIATTIRLSAFSRRREIGIMRLVGASNRFIQTPFILEGVFASLIGSLLAGGAVVAIVHFFVRGYLVKSVGNSTGLVGVDDALVVVPILVLIGGVLAATSAGVAISRYLKV